MSPKSLAGGLVAALLAMGGAGLATSAAAVENDAFLLDSTADLAALCGAQPTDANYAEAVHMCQGFIIATHLFHEALARETNEDIYCDENAPEMSRNEVMAHFADWAARRPDMAQTNALDGLLTWAEATFPCN